MIVLSDALFLYSVSFALYFLVIGIVYSLAILTTMMLLLFLPVHTRFESNSGEKGMYALVGFAENTFLATTSALTSIFVHIFKSFLYLYPFFLLAVMLATVHRNYQSILLMLENSYNLYLVDTSFVRMLRVSAWFGKVTAEVVVPIWNYLIDTVISLVRNFGYYFTTSPRTRDAVLTIVQSFGAFFTRGSAAIVAWVDILRACRYSEWADQVTELSGTPACLQFRHRELDLESTFEALQLIGVSLVSIAGTICPVAKNMILLLTYPLSDERLSAIMSAAVNFVIQVVFDTWDITALRCRLVVRLERSKVFCVPDLKPIIYYPHKFLEMGGELLDNWLEELCNNIFGLVMLKVGDDGSAVSLRILSQQQITEAFGSDEVKALRMSKSTMAYTNGVDVLYDSGIGNGQEMLRNAFQPAVDLRYGAAPVVFKREPDEINFDGVDATSIMGCGCAMQGSKMHLFCSVARFSRSASYRKDDGDAVTEIPVDFEIAYSAQYLSCDTIQVTVEPILFPQISSDASDDRVEYRGQVDSALVFEI